MLDPYSNRNTWFVAKLRNAQSKKGENSSDFFSPKKRKAFHDDGNYACVPNVHNNSLYLSEAPYSGRFLNSQNLSRENIHHKVIFSDSSESYGYDKVYHENCEYKHSPLSSL